MAKERTHYIELGIAQTATADEIKKAFRTRARECHPDRNPGSLTAGDELKRVNLANDTLSDPDKRAAYDSTLVPAPALPGWRTAASTPRSSPPPNGFGAILGLGLFAVGASVLASRLSGHRAGERPRHANGRFK